MSTIRERSVDRIVCTEKLDRVLSISSGGFHSYKICPEHYIYTPHDARLLEVGKELAKAGFRNTPRGEGDDGDLMLRLFTVKQLPSDNLFNLDLGELGAEVPKRKFILLRVKQFVPLVGETIFKVIVIGVPAHAAEENCEWHDDVFLADVSGSESGMTKFQDIENWTADEFYDTTWYRCNRDELRQTLEVVFDITPGGYIPLKGESAKADTCLRVVEVRS